MGLLVNVELSICVNLAGGDEIVKHLAKMIIFKDLISKDELLSDVFKMKTCENDIFYIVDAKMVTRTDKVDDSMIGGNASAEEAAEGCEDASVSGINLVIDHRLVETQMDKKGYQTYLKSYMKAVKAKNEENGKTLPDDWQGRCTKAVKKVLGEFKEYQFFMSEKMDPDGMLALCKWDGETPQFLFFKDGLVEEKV